MSDAMDQTSAPATPEQSTNTANGSSGELRGVGGWLKFFIVVNMYIAPIFFGLVTIVAWIGYVVLADRYPGTVFTGLVTTVVGLVLVVKFVRLAQGLRDIQPGIVPEVKKWLTIALVWNLISVPLSFLSGLDAEDLMVGSIKQVVLGVVSFAIWYSYFNVSQRVKATYGTSVPVEQTD